MAQWHYADRDRLQKGPIDDAELVRLFRSGEIGPDTLVWRPDLSEWQALSAFAAQLGLQDAASPYAPPTSAVLAEEPVVAGGEVVYAGFWKRVAAYTIDTFAAGMVGGLIGGLLGGVLGAMLLRSGNASDSASAMLVIQGVANLIGLILGVAYFAGFHSSRSMATLGKMAVGIKVVRPNGERISFLRGVGRYFALFVSTITLMIGFAMAGFTERKRALHDMLCDTVVVDKWAFTAHPEWQRRELGAVTIVVLVLFAIMLAIFFIAMAVAVYAASQNWR